MAYFTNNQHTKKGIDANSHILDGIYNIKGKSTLYVMVINYTNEYITFEKGHCTGHMEPTINRMPQTPVNSVSTGNMMGKEA